MARLGSHGVVAEPRLAGDLEVPLAADRDDEALLQAWARGDDASGRVLVERYFDVLYRFFAARVGDAAADLVQRTFLACMEARGPVERVESFKAYLLGVARHQFLKHLRKEGRRKRTHEAWAEAPADPAASITSDLALREEQRLLLRALRRLPTDLQFALEMYYWENLTTDEIGSVLEVPRGTVMSRLFRARQLLREAITELAADPAVATTTVRDLEAWARSLRGLWDPR